MHLFKMVALTGKRSTSSIQIIHANEKDLGRTQTEDSQVGTLKHKLMFIRALVKGFGFLPYKGIFIHTNYLN